MSGGLVIEASVAVGGFRAEYALAVPPGEVLAVLGPNGAGKSTLLRAIAGLVPLERGTLRLDGLLAEEAPGGPRLSTRDRGLGVVFQDYVLFEHLSALDNVAFGLRARGAGRREGRAIAADWLARLGVAELTDRRPAELSGGQAQKVALARALATSPRVLLLDEPLAALDVESRSEVRAELRRALADFDGAALVVTHDPADAAALADRIAIVEHGTVTQLAVPEELAKAPASPYVAALVGRTGFEVVLRSSSLAEHAGLGAIHGRTVQPEGVAMPADPAHVSGRRMFASIRSVKLEILPGLARSAPAERGGAEDTNTWPAEVVRIERDLGAVTATLLVGDAQPKPRLTLRLALDAGARIPGGLREGETVLVRLPSADVAFAPTI